VTGKVDLEGATQTVDAAGLKGAAGTVPQTRVDTAAVGAKQRAAVAEAAAAAKKPAPATRKSPVLAIGAGAVLLALGVGAFAFKDRILHSGATPIDTTRGGGKGPDTAQVVLLSHQDSLAQGLIRPPRNAGGGGKPPRDTTTPRTHDTTTPTGGGPPPKRDETAINSTLDAILDSIIDDPARRNSLRTRAEALFAEPGLSTTLRGKAAVTVGQAYMEDKNNTRAREWFVKAAALDSKWQANVDNLDKNSN
jgi:hypothetical protein